MEQSETGNITAALCKAIMQIGTVHKTGYNAFHKYHYASDTDIKLAVQPAFAMNGLALRPVKVVSLDGSGEARSTRIDMLLRWRLSHTSGEWMDFEVASTGMDSGDKAVYKAITGNIKYALSQICIIPTDDDAERDSRTAGVPAVKAKTSHDSSWALHREEFCGAVAALGYTYETVSALCVELGRPRPSSMEDGQRLKLLGYLKSDLGQLKMKALEAQ